MIRQAYTSTCDGAVCPRIGDEKGDSSKMEIWGAFPLNIFLIRLEANEQSGNKVTTKIKVRAKSNFAIFHNKKFEEQMLDKIASTLP